MQHLDPNRLMNSELYGWEASPQIWFRWAWRSPSSRAPRELQGRIGPWGFVLGRARVKVFRYEWYFEEGPGSVG